MSIVKTSSKGQVVIPKDIREKLGITPGKRLLFRVIENHVEITPLPDDPIKQMRGILRGGKSMATALLKERQKDNQIDEKHSI
ncbi:MAG: AbrB/MazE/SpoVT family DNA-binding domain-containing protein [Desulfobacterales bacterium]|nr:AbrB/MazE/SpoVT family DNA-binding domain-containing protein [Desulfobacterales bacterium]